MPNNLHYNSNFTLIDALLKMIFIIDIIYYICAFEEVNSLGYMQK